MNILFATARRYPPDQHGGAQNSAHALLRRVVARGHACEVAAARAPGPGLFLFRLAHLASGGRWFGRPDDHNGYPVRRAAPWQIGRLVAARSGAFALEVLVTDQPEIVDEIAPLGLPTVLRIADVSFRTRDPAFAHKPGLRLFANSHFIADALRAQLGVDAPVLYPIVEPEQCRARTHDPRTVTFINPIEGKGLDVAIRTAQLLPHRPFVFVSGWPRPTDETARLRARLAPLRNVVLVPWSPDIRTVYAHTKVLLFPARWEEGFGRVVLEAHANGIPVVASDRGGLPEAVGAGGRTLPYDAPDDAWAGAVERLLSDDAYYARCADAAEANLRRPEFDAERIADRFVELLNEAVAAQHGAV